MHTAPACQDTPPSGIEHPSGPTSRREKALMGALAAAISALTAVLAAVLARADGESLPGSALTGGAAFATALALVVMVAEWARGS